ncbi:hypothetical protein ACH49M_32930 [Rhodococcus qingshengii]|uniref:hypothetical protein n=1 Tax=Rhodococcus erythropolis group TaxID=2840174 RepID=UPI0001A21A9D|nr:hypothetical protein RHOER0001_4592 [Rhodococcus erythropolis SK121]
MSGVERLVNEVSAVLDTRAWQVETATARLEGTAEEPSEDFPEAPNSGRCTPTSTTTNASAEK